MNLGANNIVKNCLLILAVCVFLTGEGQAITYDAVTGFSGTSNDDSSTWSYRYSHDLERDGDYILLPTFDSRSLWDLNNPDTAPNHYWHVEDDHGIGANRTGGSLQPSGVAAPFLWPDHTIWMHPDGATGVSAGFIVLSWLAPTDGTANISYSFADMDPNGGDGVDWFIDLGDSTGNLASGSVWSGSTTSTGSLQITNVAITSGKRINFVVSPGPSGLHNYDSTELAATITFTSVGGGEANPPVVTNPQSNPDNIPNDEITSAILTANVTDPDGDLASVVIDLSLLGGSSSQVMYDNGTNGDVTASNGIYSLQTTASSSTPVAFKALKVTATDQNGNTGSNVIGLFVTSKITETSQPESTESNTIVNGIAGQTLNISYTLVDEPPYSILQAEPSNITLTVKRPDGEIYTTETMSTTTNTLRIPDAEAGTWTYEVDNESSTQRTYWVETVTGGIGIVSGMVTDADTSGNLTGVLLTTDTGGVALSVDGYYVMVTVAGVFTVTASSFGYTGESEANVTLTAGQTETVDFSLTAVTIDELQLVGITTDLASIPQTGAPVKLTANATGPNTIYYKFLYRAGYGTAAYATNQFVTAQNWSTSNSANITFPSADNYIVIVQATEDATGIWVFGDPQGGMNIYVGNPSDLQVKSIATSTLAGIPTAGQPVTVSANRTGSVVAYYRFLYRAGYGTAAYATNQFITAQNWSADNTADITFPSADNYIVIVQASEDATGTWAFGDPQGGLNLVIRIIN